MNILADHGDIYARCVVVFSSSKVGFEYILVDVKTKEKSHKNLSSYGFWRRARDSIRATAVAWSLAVTTVHQTVALYRSSFESLLNFCKQKRNRHRKCICSFSWRRARDSNPRTGYSPLHDFQEDSVSPKVVDIHRVSPSHILVATAEIDILIILVSGIYVTAIVVFPSSKVVCFAVQYKINHQMLKNRKACPRFY